MGFGNSDLVLLSGQLTGNGPKEIKAKAAWNPRAKTQKFEEQLVFTGTLLSPQFRSPLCGFLLLQRRAANSFSENGL